MYPYILFTHSLIRWLVLASLIYAVFIAVRGWWRGDIFTKRDDMIRHVTATIVHVQFLVAIWLYSISPIIRYFYRSYQEAVHDRSIRYFGMEHSVMMLAAVIIVTIGSMVSKRQVSDTGKYRVMAICYGLGLLIILFSIPWPFSPMVGRPWVRGM